MHAESYAEGFKKVYTFGPTFRAENSHTSRHLAEFWMMEPEVAFCDLKGIIEITDDMLKNVIANTLKNYPEEMKFLDSLQNNKLIESLNNFINKKLTIIEYKDVVENLKNYVDKFEEKISFRNGLSFRTRKIPCWKHHKRPCCSY